MKHEKYIIQFESTILSSLQQMDENNCKLLLVFKGDKFESIVSIGDIQRSLIKDNNFQTIVGNTLRENVTIAKDYQTKEEVEALMLKYRIEFMPVVDEDNNLVEVVFWDDIVDHEKTVAIIEDKIPVVIMAGGKGTRLRPITNIIPKPLVPIGERSMVEIIMDSFKSNGLNEFYMSVNYKADIIKYYLAEFADKYNVDYFTEDKPLGTAGSLKLLEDKINSTFFVSNCDILIDQDYSEVYNYHKLNNNELTAVAAVKTYTIPYGTMELSNNGLLKELKEKPSNTYYVNAGLYILEPHLLDEIPKDKFFHITHLMDNIVKRGGKVGVFPVSQGAWMDIGDWNEYNETQKRFRTRLNLNS